MEPAAPAAARRLAPRLLLAASPLPLDAVSKSAAPAYSSVVAYWLEAPVCWLAPECSSAVLASLSAAGLPLVGPGSMSAPALPSVAQALT
jgi:hypothetical protein